MIQKSHCKILYEDGYEDNIAQFYQFATPEEDWKDLNENDLEMASDSGEEESGDAREDGAWLVLPNGKKIGHRSFTRYWNQNLRPERVIPGSQAHL